MDLINLAIGLIGTASTLVIVYERGIRRFGVRRLLGLAPKMATDVVCTTGGMTRSKYSTSAAMRGLTPEGELQGVAAIANALGRWYPRSQLTLQLATRVVRKLDKDLLLLGGPSGNSCSAEVLRWPSLAPLVSIDAPNSSMVVGQFAVSGYDHGSVSGKPARDLAVIVCSSNCWSPRSRRRMYLFAGLTTYATGASVEYFFDELGTSLRPFNPGIRKELRKRHTVLIIIEATFNDGHVSGCSIKHWESHSV